MTQQRIIINACMQICCLLCVYIHMCVNMRIYIYVNKHNALYIHIYKHSVCIYIYICINIAYCVMPIAYRPMHIYIYIQTYMYIYMYSANEMPYPPIVVSCEAFCKRCQWLFCVAGHRHLNNWAWPPLFSSPGRATPCEVHPGQGCILPLLLWIIFSWNHKPGTSRSRPICE